MSFKYLPVCFQAFLLLVLTLSSCQPRVTYPALSDSPATTPETGGIVWRDLVTRDPESAERFYGEVFGWRFEALGKGAYWVIHREDEPIGGVFPMPATANPGSTAEWLVAMAVPSVSRASDVLEDAGGQVVAGRQDLPGRGPTAVVADPQGGLFTLVSRGRLDGSVPPLNDWLWTELWSNDVEASVGFYAKLFDVEAETRQDDDRDYFLFRDGDTHLAGMIRNPVENTRTHWVPYIRISDPAATAEAIRNAGGTVLAGPSPNLRNGSVVVAMDPSGAHFVAQQWND